jgi:ABC-2 type transport system ATP-binding protein
MSLDPVISLHSVSKCYGTQQALDHVSLEVPPGVVFALLGENGAGKTSAIRIMLGLAPPDTGQVHVLGMDSTQQGLAIRRQIGYVAERPSLDEWMTADEIGWFAAGFHDDNYLARYRTQIDAFQVPRDRKLKQLSKGMRSKIALSLALANNPQLLILDEPTSGLDAIVRREFLESMVELTSDGKTVFLSSHQIHEVERVADMVAILRRGKLLACESLDTLKSQVTEITCTIDGASQSFEAPAGCLTCEARGKQHRLMMRATEEDAVRTVAALPRVQHVTAQRPSLEDIFVAFMHATDPTTTAHAATATHATSANEEVQA